MRVNGIENNENGVVFPNSKVNSEVGGSTTNRNDLEEYFLPVWG